MAVTPADLRRAAGRRHDGLLALRHRRASAGGPRLRPGGVDRDRRRGRPPLCHDGVRPPATRHRPVQRHRDRGAAARPRHRAHLDLHGSLSPAFGACVGGDHRAEDHARHAREAVEPGALRGPPHRRTRHLRLRSRSPPGSTRERHLLLVRADPPESCDEHDPRPGRRVPARAGRAVRWLGRPQRDPRRALPDRERDQLLHRGEHTTNSDATTARRSTTATSRRGSPTTRSTTWMCRSCRS